MSRGVLDLLFEFRHTRLQLLDEALLLLDARLLLEDYLNQFGPRCLDFAVDNVGGEVQYRGIPSDKVSSYS